jgi:hypothetical protein
MVYDFGRGHGYNYQRDTASPRLGGGAFANGGRGGDSMLIDRNQHHFCVSVTGDGFV